MKYSQEKIKYLEFIENIINRHNNNSFQIKTFAITISAALLAIYADKGNKLMIIVSLIVVCVFWILDSTYLLKERQYRDLYKAALKKKGNSTLFNLDVSQNKYYIFSIIKTMFSKTLVLLYLSMIIVLLILFYYNFG